MYRYVHQPLARSTTIENNLVTILGLSPENSTALPFNLLENAIKWRDQNPALRALHEGTEGRYGWIVGDEIE